MGMVSTEITLRNSANMAFYNLGNLLVWVSAVTHSGDIGVREKKPGQSLREKCHATSRLNGWTALTYTFTGIINEQLSINNGRLRTTTLIIVNWEDCGPRH